MTSDNPPRGVDAARRLCGAAEIGAALLLLLLSTLPAGAAAAADAQGLQALLQRLSADHRICAAAVATVRNRLLQPVDTASGCGAAQKPDAETVFQAASLGKPVFAYAVLKLAEQGTIDLDAPVSSVLPAGYLHRQNPFDDRTAPVDDRVAAAALTRVTPRMLLQHTAGLPAWSRHGPLKFDFVPGSRWQYSGEGYVLLQRVVEAATGKPVAATLRELVFEPLGMSHSAFSWQPQLQPLLAAGTAEDGSVLALVHFGTPIVAATLYTTAPDYGRFLAALLGDQQLLRAVLASPAVVDAALDLSWGGGWGLERGGDGGNGEGRPWRLWQWGSNPGYRAFVMAAPATGDAVVLLTNSENGLAIAEPIVDAVLPGTHSAFRSRMVGGAAAGWLCRTIGWCR